MNLQIIVDMKNQINHQFLDFVRQNEIVKVLQILQDKDQENQLDKTCTDDLGNTALHLSLFLPSSEIAWVLIKAGWNLSTPNADHKVPLHYAACHGHCEIVTYLFSQNLPIEPQTNDGLTPLHLAAYDNQTESCRLLLENGANVNITDKGFRTPLHFAAFNGYTQPISYLLSKGANPHLQDDRGNIPLAYAIINHHMDAIKLFPITEPVLKIRNAKNQTIIELAQNTETREIIEYIQSNSRNTQ